MTLTITLPRTRSGSSGTSRSPSRSGSPIVGAKALAMKKNDGVANVEVRRGSKTLLIVDCKRPCLFRVSAASTPDNLSKLRSKFQDAALRQVMKYMKNCDKGYAMLTSFDVSYFIRRCKSRNFKYDTLEISDGICWDSSGPSLLGAMHYMLTLAKDNMETSYKSLSKANSTQVSNEDDNDTSTNHEDQQPPGKRPAGDSPRGEEPQTKRYITRSGGLQELAEESLHLNSTPFARGWSGNIVVGEIEGQRVAVKLVPRNSRRQKVLEHEAAVYNAVRDLWGKYVPKLIAHGTTAFGDVIFLATEFVDGLTFSNVDITPTVATEARAALAALHSHGFLHGDLHGKNILVVEDGVRLLDFGFSRIVASSSECETEMKQLEHMIHKHGKL